MASQMKRKIKSEGRKFNERWTNDYFFIEYNEKAICLICKESILTLKEYNLQRHYNTKHKETYDNLTGNIRTNKIKILISSLTNQQNIFKKVCTQNETAVRASYKISKMIAQSGRPFTDGEFVKKCMEVVIEEICPEKKRMIQDISLSARTVVRRIVDIGTDLFQQLREIGSSIQYFSLALDESSDVKDTAQLLIFIRGVTEEFVIYEELAAMCSLKGRTTSEDIFQKVEETVTTLKLDWKQLRSITTDGAMNMSGYKNGVVALVANKVKETGTESPLIIHCIIHQQALCMKILKWNTIMDVIISTVNFIRRNSLNHRQFQDFLSEIESEYGDVIYHTEVRWLSKGNVIKRFFYLREEIHIFLIEKGKHTVELTDPNWVLQLAFFIDISSYMNELNLKLQGKGKLIGDSYSDIKSFELKLELLKNNTLQTKLHNLPFCKEIMEKEKDLFWPTNEFVENIQLLQNEFSRRFSEFHKHSTEIKLFQNPFAIELQDVPDQLQMEIVDLQTNNLLKDAFHTMQLTAFYASLSSSNFPNLKKFSAGMTTIFSSTYICEQTFSQMKYIKSNFRSQMTDEHLHANLRIATTNLEFDFNRLVRDNIKKPQVSH